MSILLKVESPQSERISLQAFNPVKGLDRTGVHENSIHHILCFQASLPLNTGRYPEYRRASFDGGLWFLRGYKCRVRPANTKATFKASSLGRCPVLDSDCFDGGEVADDVCRGICVAPQTFPLLSCAVAYRMFLNGRGTATTFKAVTPGGVLTSSTD